MLYDQGGMDLVSGLPYVITFGVPLPFDEILELL